jgi:hypothetical protein
MAIPGFSLKSKEFIVLASALAIFELTRVLVRLDHVARFIVNANDGIM